MVLQNVARVEDFFRGMGIEVVTGSRYLGGFVGNREADDRCLADKLQGWKESVKICRGSPASTHSPLTQNFRSHSNRS